MCDLQSCSDGLRHIRRWHIQWISVIRISCTRNRAQLIVQKKRLNNTHTYFDEKQLKHTKTNSYIKRLVEHSRTGHIPNCPSGQSASLGSRWFYWCQITLSSQRHANGRRERPSPCKVSGDFMATWCFHELFKINWILSKQCIANCCWYLSLLRPSPWCWPQVSKCFNQILRAVPTV